jgi:hypothetical protein
VSNKSIEFSIPKATLLFTVLILATGALLLASQSIDPIAFTRPTPAPTVVDAFTNLEYTAWNSPDGIFQLEYPSAWTIGPDPNGTPLFYYLAPSATQNTVISLAVVNKSNLGIAGTTSDTSPEQILKLFFATQPPDQQPREYRSIQVAGLQGTAVHYSGNVTNQSTGQQSVQDQDLWVLSLDATHLLIIQALTETVNWPKLKLVLDHLASTLKVDSAAAVAKLDAQATLEATLAAPPATESAAPTAEATAAATTAATTEATAPATAPATAAATTNATAAATAAH